MGSREGGKVGEAVHVPLGTARRPRVKGLAGDACRRHARQRREHVAQAQPLRRLVAELRDADGRAVDEGGQRRGRGRGQSQDRQQRKRASSRISIGYLKR